MNGDIVTREASPWREAWRQLRRRPGVLLAASFVVVMVVMAAFPRLFTAVDPRDCDLARSLRPPSAQRWLGYDLQGCDYWARVVHGARASIAVGVLVTLVATTIAVLGGAVAGYRGGVVDAVIGRVTDVWFAIPLALGALVLLSTLPRRGVPQVALVLAVFAWPTLLRLMRASVLTVAGTEYVEAARALGAGEVRILWGHVIPNAITPVIAHATLLVGYVITAEAALTFLGVGLQLPAVSWGLMISVAQRRLLQAPHLLLFPGLLLSLTVLSFIVVGDALRDVLDPRSGSDPRLRTATGDRVGSDPASSTSTPGDVS